MSAPPTQFKSQADLIDYLAVLEQRLSQLEGENKMQKLTIEDLYRERKPAAPAREIPVLPDTNILSPNYLKRAFAVWGHYFVAQLIISIVIMIIYLIFFLIFVAAAGGSSIFGG